MKSIRRLFGWIDTCANYAAAVALLATFLMTFLNVVMRYVFKGGFSWSEEGARYGLVFLIILGTIETSHHREHFGLDLLTSKLKGVWALVLLVIQDLLALSVSLVLAVGSLNMAILNLYNTTPAMKIPSWLPYGFLCMSAGISVLHSIYHFLVDTGIAKEPEEGKEEPKC